MSYTLTSPLLGTGTASAGAIQAWLEARGRAAAPRYGVGADPANNVAGTYTPVPPDLGQIIVDECARWPQAPINHDIAAAQIDEETAGWQSEFARVRLNPGGIGAEDDNPDEAYAFPTLRAGVRAHISHMLTYAAGVGPWNATDPRFNHTPAAWRGTTTTIGALAGRWATQPHYGEYVRDRANLLLAFATTWTGDTTAMGDIPGVPFVAADLRHYTPGRAGYQWPDLCIQHHTDGSDSLDWLTKNANSRVSATYLFNRDGTIRAQLVRHADTPHTTGEVLNPRSLTAEWERKWTNGSASDREVSDSEYENIAASWVRILTAEKARGNPNFQGVLQRRQFTSHREQYPSYSCPGNLDIERVYRLIVTLQSASPTPADPMADIVADPWGASNPWGQFWTPRVFATDMLAHGLPATGYLVSGMFVEDGRNVQYTERCRLEWNPTGTGGYVTRELLGLKALIARHPDRDPTKRAA